MRTTMPGIVAPRRRLPNAAGCSTLAGDRPPQVGAGGRVQALVEEVAEVDAWPGQQRLEEAAPVGPVQPAGHVAAVFGGDGAVVGVERVRIGAEDRHVAIEEMAG